VAHSRGSSLRLSLPVRNVPRCEIHEAARLGAGVPIVKDSVIGFGIDSSPGKPRGAGHALSLALRYSWV
jgi:hypothetical protein